jgi:hypothetical protein
MELAQFYQESEGSLESTENEQFRVSKSPVTVLENGSKAF